MKWKHYFVLFGLLFLFTACSNNASQVKQKEKEDENKNPSFSQSSNLQHENSNKEENAKEVIQETPIETSVINPQYRVNPTNFNIEPIQDADNHVVLLTIDDAPDQFALEMAKTLNQLNVKAIFFVNGHFLASEDQKRVLKEIHDMGFPIGNHSMTHQNLKKLSKEQQYQEIVKVNDLVEEITGERPKFFRAPFGANTDYSRELALKEQMVVMNWSYGYDFMKDYMSKGALTNIMVNTELLHNGANLLMHDRKWTNEALKDIVTGLENKGYTVIDPHLIKTLK
ncbi:polysaccharide deacetylase family protein [Schinkia sp. CFF1]